MPRQARVIVPGYPHHIVQRGHNRQPDRNPSIDEAPGWSADPFCECPWLDVPDSFRALASSYQMRVEAYRQFVE